MLRGQPFQMKKTILVIDDEQPFRLAVMQTLRRHGYEAIGAADGVEGLWQALQRLPDLVLTDVNMAGPTGYEVVKEIRFNPQTAAIPVIVMTGKPQNNSARDSMDLGADLFLEKPFPMETLILHIEGQLKRVGKSPFEKSPDFNGHPR